MSRIVDIEDVLKEYTDYQSFSGHPEYDNGFDTGIFAVIEALENLPVKNNICGKWIVQDSTYTKFQCSVCKSKNHSTQWPFCCKCGAKMDLE